MAQHPLTRRIRRVLQLEEDPMLVSRTTVAGSVATLVVVALVACNYPSFAGDGKEQDKAAVAQESTDAQEEAKEGASDKQESEEQAKPANPHFMTLEDQRVADLMYGMFQMEVEPLDGRWLPLVKEAGFSGGVLMHNQGSQQYILVGIHVWPVETLDDVGEVLRRSDLEEFNPLQLYRLTPVTKEGEGEGKELRHLLDTEAHTDVELSKVNLRLTTHRYHFEARAWRAEQERLQVTSGIEPSVDMNAKIVRAVVESRTREKPLLVLCYSPDSHPSLKLLESLRNTQIPVPNLQQIHVNTERHPRAAQSMKIAQTPTVVYFKNGREVGRLINASDVEHVVALVQGRTKDENAQDTQKPSRHAEPPAVFRDEPTPPRNSVPTSREIPVGSIEITPPIGAKAQDTSTTPAPAKTQLRYNDKSFDEWRTLWRTELNPEKRIEAIHAMTAFGRAGYGKEAVEAILDVAEEYSTAEDTTKSPEGRLLQAIIASLTGYRGETNPIPAHVVLPFLKEKYEAQPEKYERLFSKVVSSLITNDPAVLKQVRALCEHDNATIRRAALERLVRRDPLTQRPETVEAIRLALADREPMNINRAITLLQDTFRRMNVSSHLKQQQFPELIPLLFHETDSVRQNARGALLFLEPTSRTRVAELLVTVVERPGESHEFDGLQLFEPATTEQAQHKVRITALRALAVIAPPSEAAYNSAAELLLDSEEDAVKIAAYVAMERIYVVGLNRARNKAFENGLREKLQEVFESPTELRESTNAELEELVAPPLHTWLFNQGVRPRREN